MIGNYIVRDGDGEVDGGAIYNNKSTAQITEITGNFIGNYLISKTYSAYGGAIINDGGSEIGKIEGKFIGNYLISNLNITNTHFSGGGAISNHGSKINSINGVFINNILRTI